MRKTRRTRRTRKPTAVRQAKHQAAGKKRCQRGLTHFMKKVGEGKDCTAVKVVENYSNCAWAKRAVATGKVRALVRRSKCWKA